MWSSFKASGISHWFCATETGLPPLERVYNSIGEKPNQLFNILNNYDKNNELQSSKENSKGWISIEFQNHVCFPVFKEKHVLWMLFFFK